MASNGPNYWATDAEYLHATVNRFQTTADVEYEVVGKVEGQEQIGKDMDSR